MERNKIKILAIDDKNDNLISLNAITSDIFPDSTMFLSLSGPEGIKIAAAEDPDVILLDIVMPDMDGFEVCRLLKKNEKTRDIPVVFLTALKGDRENHIKALEAGAEAFLSKPIDETELTAQIRAMVKIKEANLRKRNEKEYLEKLIAERTLELEKSRIATLNLLDDLKEEIKARNVIEKKLSKSEEHFRSLIENSSEGISVIDIMGNTIYSSPSMKNVLGYSEESVKKINFLELVHPEYLNTASEIFKRFISGKTNTETVQILMKHKSGEYVWIEATGTNMLENDSIKGIVVNFRDINERKKAEQKLSVMAKMLDIAPSAITIHDLDGKFIYTNSKNLELHGYTFDEMMSLNLHQLDAPESETLINERVEKIKKNGEASFEVFHFRKDGSSFPLQVFAKIIDWQGSPALISIASDISERLKSEKALKESEAMTRAILTASTESVLLITNDGTLLAANETMAKRNGKELDEIIGKNVFEIVNPKVADLRKEKADEAIRTKKPVQFEDVRNDRNIMNYIYPVVSEGKVSSLAIYGIDITELRLTEEKVRLSEEKFRSLITQMKSGLAVHEIILDKNGVPVDYRFLDVNPSFERLTGLKRDDIIGRTVLEILPGTEKIWIEKYGQVVLTGEPVSFENYHHELGRFYSVVAYRPREKQFAVVVEDITDRKKAEEKLNENLALMRIAGEIAKMGGWTVDLKENRSYWSDQVAAIHEAPAGFAPLVEEGIGFYAPEWREKITQAFTACAKEGIPYNEKMEIITATGKRVWIKTIGEAVKNEKGEIVKVHGAFQDITEEVEAEKMLKESEERFKALHNASFGGIAIHDKGLILECNQGLSDITGYSYEELIGMNGLLLIAEHARDTVVKNISEGYELPYESTGVRKNGEEYPLRLEARNVPFKGRHVRTVEFRDITNQKKSEQLLRESEKKYRLIAENMGNIITMLDMDLNFIYVSPNIEKTVGFSVEEYLQMNVSQTMTPESLELVLKTFEEEMSLEITGSVDPQRSRVIELEEFHKDGSTIWMENILSFIRDEDGRPVSILAVSRDITEKRRTEAELEKNRKFLSDIIENSGSLIFVKDVNGKYILTNSRWETATGLKRENTLGKTDLELFADPMGKQFKENDVSVIESGEPLYVEETLEKNGKKFFFHSIKFPLRNESGDITGVCGMSTDITEIKLAEEKLRKSENTLQKIFDTLPIGLWFADNTGKLVSGNPAGIKIWGAEPKVGIEEYGIFKARKLPEMTEISPDEWALAKTIKEGVTISNELLEIDAFDGKKKIILNYTAPIIDKDTVLGAIVINEDVTEMKKAEEAIRESENRFRAVLEYSHSAICIINTEGKIVWANEALVRIGGYSREEICSAPSFAQFIAPDSVEFVSGNFVKFVSGNDYEHHYNFYFIRSDGSKRLMEKHMTDYTDKNGQRFLAVSMSDITEKKEAEEEKEKLQAQLYQIQKMESIGRLAGGVAHDFNNMLSVIIGRTELAMIKAAPPSPLFSELSEIKIAAEKSAALTGQLLAFARKQTTTPKIVSLNDEIGKMFKMLKRLIGENIELVWKKEKNLWNIMIDPSQIDQILANLCINAKDAISENGKITIETANVRIEEEKIKNIPEIISGDYVLLKVSDNGCGMNDETVKHIFEPFFTTKEVGKGTGLGLSTVFGIVKQNRGYISVESVAGHGTEFSIYFPSQNDTVSDMRSEGSQDDTKKGNGIILLVEDESSILEMTETMLKSFGYEVISANSPQEAINKALEHAGAIDLLITDIIMPEINGRELAKKIMTYHPGIKCLFMSGYTADIIAKEGVISEKMNFIQKPFTMNKLSLKIREIFEQK